MRDTSCRLNRNCVTIGILHQTLLYAYLDRREHVRATSLPLAHHVSLKQTRIKTLASSLTKTEGEELKERDIRAGQEKGAEAKAEQPL